MSEELDDAMLEMLNPKTGRGKLTTQRSGTFKNILFTDSCQKLWSTPESYVAFELLYSIIHRISSLVFVGRQHCHDLAWTRAVRDLPVNVEITKFILLSFPSSLRNFIAPIIPQPNNIFRQRKLARDVLFPFGNVVAGDEPSVLKLLIESKKDHDPDSLTARLLLLTAAAVGANSIGILDEDD